MENNLDLVIIIEDNQRDADAIANHLRGEYSVAPQPRSELAVNLGSCFATYNNLEYRPKTRDKRRAIISEFLDKLKSEVRCFIVDYRLKHTSDRLIKDKNGVLFCRNFKREMGAIPILFLTSTEVNSECKDITDFIEEEKEFRHCYWLLKSDDWMTDPDFGKELLMEIKKLIARPKLNLPPARN